MDDATKFLLDKVTEQDVKDEEAAVLKLTSMAQGRNLRSTSDNEHVQKLLRLAEGK